MELRPKAVLHRHEPALAFYEAHPARVVSPTPGYAEPIEAAEAPAGTFGLNAPDAPHVASAVRGDAGELVTADRPNKPIHRVTQLGILEV